MMRTAIKWASTSLERVAATGKVALQQVAYLGKVVNATTWTPYGFDSSPPKDKLALLFAILGNPDNQVALVGSPGEGPKLALGEVVIFHPGSGSKIHFLKDGSIQAVSGVTSLKMAPSGGITIIPGSAPVTVSGDLAVTGDLSVTGTATLGNATVLGTTTLGAAVTSAGTNIGSTHVHAAGALLDSVALPCTGSTATPS